MTDPFIETEDAAGDARLRALFQRESMPPRRDSAFAHAAMQQIAVRRFWFNLLAALPWVVAASAALWAFGPVMSDLAREAARRWAQDPILLRGFIHAATVLAPAGAVLLGLAFMVGPQARRL